jgi:hypothetical protein
MMVPALRPIGSGLRDGGEAVRRRSSLAFSILMHHVSYKLYCQARRRAFRGAQPE